MFSIYGVYLLMSLLLQIPREEIIERSLSNPRATFLFFGVLLKRFKFPFTLSRIEKFISTINRMIKMSFCHHNQ